MLDVVAAGLEEKLSIAFAKGQKIMLNFRTNGCVCNAEIVVDDYFIKDGSCEIINGNSFFILGMDNIEYDDFDDVYLFNNNVI